MFELHQYFLFFFRSRMICFMWIEEWSLQMVKLHTINHTKWHKKIPDEEKNVLEYYVWESLFEKRRQYVRAYPLTISTRRQERFCFTYFFFIGRTNFCFFSFLLPFFFFFFLTHQHVAWQIQLILHLNAAQLNFYILIFKLCHEKWWHEAASATAPNAKYNSDCDWAWLLWLYVRYATPEPIQNTDNFVRLLVGGSKPHASKKASWRNHTTYIRPCMKLQFAQNMPKLS